MEKIKHFFVAHFATSQDMHGALRRVADDVRNARGGPDNKTVKVYNERGPGSNQPRYGAGSWQASNRGGVQGDAIGDPHVAAPVEQLLGRGGRGGRGSFRGGEGAAAASTGGES